MPQGVGAVMAYIEGKLHNMRGIVQTQEMYKYKQPLNVQPALRKGAEAAVQRLGEIREEMAQGQYGKARMELHHDIRVATDFLEFQIGLRNPQGRIPVTDNLRWIVRSAVTLDHLENLQRQLSNPNANQPRLPHLESVSNSRSRMWYNEG